MSGGNAIVLGHPEAHEKLTAHLLWRCVEERGLTDAGNVKEYTDATSRKLVVRSKSRQGFRQVNNEQVDVNHQAWTFLLDERVPQQERLISLARLLPDQAQAANEAASATIEDVAVGRWFDIGAYNIVNVSVNASQGGQQQEGVDYELDAENGRLLVMTGGGIGDGEDLNVVFDKPGIDFQVHESQDRPCFYCQVVIEEHNQHSKVFLRRNEMLAYVSIVEFPSQTGEFGHYRARVTAADTVRTIKRPEASTLPTHPVGTAGNSSSSSSSSSTSLSSSSSSSSSTATAQSSSSSTLASVTSSLSSASSKSSSSSSTNASVSSANSSSTSSASSSSSTSLSSSSSPSSSSFSSSSSRSTGSL